MGFIAIAVQVDSQEVARNLLLYGTGRFGEMAMDRVTVLPVLLITPIAFGPQILAAFALGMIASRERWFSDLQAEAPPASTGALERLRELVGTGKTATDPDEVVAAGRAGSVAELLVVRSETHVGETSPAPAADRTAVVAAVNDGLRHRARIHLVGDETLPAGARFAAVLRY